MTADPAAPGADVAFTTSGTTGAPVTWLRTTGQLAAEAALLAEELGPVDHVVSYAPARHLYGRILGVEVPRLLGAPVTDHGDDPLVPPALDRGARTLVVCLPSTWQLLLRRLPRLAECRAVVAVHSTARVPRAAHEVAGRLAGTGFRAVDVLGSTETGAVATRPVDPVRREEGVWRLLPDVTWDGADAAPGAAPPAAARLTVGGPRLARQPGGPRPATVTMPDLVVPAGPRGFRRLGRSPGLVKVNGVRCDLGLVEALVRRVAPGADAVCVPVADEVRGEHYALYYAGPSAVGPAELRARLATALGTLPGPRSVARVRRLPSPVPVPMPVPVPPSAVATGEEL
ncbi:AMP-binding protein [Streptomyces sp. DH12]|uniref:AMP-binding protein n=1 Tax=Streptomyces sp. DH12 TaxID=2857010 RepID=UPI001E403198|nr:AMP-binding protein [Streptomyces sp. DH12]